MTPKDFNFALKLTDIEHWNYTRKDFERMLYCEPEGCFVATKGRKGIGIITTISYGNLGWIGNSLVLPEERGAGVGSKLVEYATKYLLQKNVDAIGLYSYLEDVPFYEKLGFMAESDVISFYGLGEKTAYKNIKEMDSGDLNTITQLDQKFFGADRERLLRKLYADHPQLCFAYFLNGKIVGFIMGSKSKDGFEIGPWVCNPKFCIGAENLLKSLLNFLCGQKIEFGVNRDNEKALKLAREFGFKEQLRVKRMFWAGRKHMENRRGIFGIGSLEMG
jgi:ribosomal protein S18 acetylase RimI-like enzyme